MNHKGLIIIITAVTLLFSPILAHCANFYVDAAKGSDENSGKSESAAWKTITHAIKTVGRPSSPAFIYVAAGLYDTSNGEVFPFYLNTNTSYIGADPETTIIDGTGSESTVLYCQVTGDLLIEGFTITGGYGVRTVHGTSFGGGIYCVNSSPAISNCIIEGNNADFGGGIYITMSESYIDGCTIRGNSATSGGGVYCVGKANPVFTGCVFSENEALRSEDQSGGFGGGILVEYESTPHIAAGCEFKNNTAGVGGGGICNLEQGNALITDCNFENNTALYGGGIMNHDNCSPIIGNCTFTANTAKRIGEEGGVGGAVYSELYCNPTINGCNINGNQADSGGGGIANLEFSSPFIADTQFIQNSALSGGGIYNNNATMIIDSCLFFENSANFTSGDSGHGGAIMGTKDSTLDIHNCILENNRADDFGGACLFLWNTTIQIFNNLFLNNSAGTDAEDIYIAHGSSAAIYSSTFYTLEKSMRPSINSTDGSSSSLGNSIIRGYGNKPVLGTTEINYCNIDGGFEGEGNIDADPLFVTGPRGDYYLSRISAGQDENSPCINAGSDTALNLGYNMKTTGTDGVFDSGIIDMGYHYAPHVGFDIWHEPEAEAYKTGDNVTIFVDLHTAPADIEADIYFVMLGPDGKIYSGLAWNQGVTPMISNFTLPASTAVNSIPLSNFTLPSTQPPVSTVGTYYVGIVTTKPGTIDFTSELRITSFKVE